MGGDYAPATTVEGSVLASKELAEDIELVLVGDEDLIRKELDKHEHDPNRFDIVHTSEVIEMGEHPTRALSTKKDSSIAVGFGLLRMGKMDSFCSTGNTGAMLVGSMYSVKSVPGVIRPCITTAMPNENGSVTIILDVGINADCRPDVLYQFALLGSIYAEHVYKMDTPRVGLLNIGEEEEKGNMLAQATHKMMKDTSDFNFIGNVEGRDIFSDEVDVIVCDGFTGNVILKQAEAFYSLIKKRDRSDDFFDQFNYENYGGTPILGVNSNVLIGHGISSSEAIKNMLLLSKEVIQANLTEKIKEAFK